jgi:hypothetical protein
MEGMVDLRSFLDVWPYDAARNVRIEHGGDGRKIILVRQPMGLEQFEADGRPDSRQVHGMESVLAFHLARLPAARLPQSALKLELSPEECAELFDEAAIFYQRLIVLVRLKDWPRVERDAAQILRLLNCTQQHAQCAGDRVHLEPWRAHLTRIHAGARTMNLLHQGLVREAIESLRDTPGLAEVFEPAATDQKAIEDRLLENVRHSLAAVPALKGREENCFLRQGEYWEIRYQGHTTFLKSMRGLDCLACLLRSPGREFHVSELLNQRRAAPTAATVVRGDRHRHESGQFCVQGAAAEGLPVLDDQAKAEYKRRVNELRQEMAEAEQFNDFARVTSVEDELNVIARHLSAAIGLGGRDRKTSSAAERARSAVTKSIKNACQKIGEALPLLGQHLTARIKTGYFCSYIPDPERTVHWKF